MPRYRGPGPGQVLQFATEVKDWTHDTKTTKGVKIAIAWVIGEHDKDPITDKRTNSYPPDMKAIADAAERAGRDPENVPKLSSQYCAGVKACLDWITGSSDSRPDEWTDAAW